MVIKILPPLSILLILSLFTPQKAAAQASCRQHDSLELVRFYSATNGDNRAVFARWDFTKPMNTWNGITLNTDGCVTRIALSNSFLTGTIHNLDLPNLTYLSIESNALTGTIPNFNLPNLTYINLGSNRLTGSIPNFNLPNLTEFIAYFNQLSANIPDFNLPNLKKLKLDYNQLSRTIPNFNLPNLTELSLAGNQLSGSIPNFNLPNLTHLSLHGNQFSGTIPNFNLPNLTEMYLQFNQLTGNVPNFNLPNLKRLSINDNKLNGIISTINCPQLISFYLNNNQLTGSIPNFYLPNVGGIDLSRNKLSGNLPRLNFPQITTLNLSFNELSGTINGLNCPIVRQLNLNNNQFSGAIPNFNSPFITSLFLNNNQFSGCIPPSFKVFCTLESGYVSIQNNPNLSTTNITEFCSLNNTGMCATLTNTCRYQDSLQLVRLYTTTNGANWSNKWHVYDLMSNWYGVTLNTNGCVSSIVLNNNNLMGTLPALDLSNLTRLDVSGNKLTGTIPDLKCPNLTTLNLNNNQLSGCLPASLKAFCGQQVNLSQNPNLLQQDFAAFCVSTDTTTCPTTPYNCRFQDSLQLVGLFHAMGGLSWEKQWDFTKPINTWVGVILNADGCVDSLYKVSYNNWIGNLPQLDLPNLRFFQAHGSISGSMPNFNFPKIEYLTIGRTQISGELPAFNFPNIRYMSFETNKLSGAIPNFNCPKLEEINLSYNQLSSSVPNFNYPNLKKIDLTFNKLTGVIPEFNLPNLTYLSLANNQLSGNLPQLTLPKVSVINFSYNQISGSIPAYNLNSFPNLLIFSLDFNQLSGCIPHSVKSLCSKITFNNNPNLAAQFTWDFCGISSVGQCDTTTNKPDLTLESLSILNPSVQKGQILNFKFDAKNIGMGNTTNNFTIKSYLSTDQILDDNDYQNGVVPTANYRAGSVITQIQGAMLVKELVASGNYYLILKIDADNQILESNETNNVIVSTNIIILNSLPLASGCLTTFNITGLNYAPSINCLPNTNSEMNQFNFNFTGQLQMYGTRIADGFMITMANSNAQTRYSTYFTSTPPTTTPPAGARFNDCPIGNWLYFTLNGVGKSGQQSFLDSNIHIRVHYWGAEINPDYVYLAFSSPNQNGGLTMLSNRKTQNCNPCFRNDRTPPVINCPDTTVTYSRSLGDYYISAQSILAETNIQASDNCGNNNLIWGMNTIYGFHRGLVYPIHLIAYDSAGNTSACDFKIRIDCRNSATTTQFQNCPIDTTISVINGQNCQIFNWLKPTTPYALLEPVKITSNYNPGDCFPIGTTKVIYTAVDSCQNVGTCRFNIQVKSTETTESDIALSITSTPSVYRQYSTQNIKIIAKKNDNQAFTNVRIDFPFPNKTVGSGQATPSVGTWSEWCSGGIQCFSWTIPTLAANTTATLDVPLYVLDAVNPIVATTRLLSSNPVDNNTANNSATIIINSANPALNPLLINSKLTAINPLIIHKITPTITDNLIVIELESIVNKTIDYQVINAFGTTVLKDKLMIERGVNKRHFNVSQLPKGMYFISINGRLNKFIKV